MCVGLLFAEAELKAMLTTLLQRYSVHLTVGSQSKQASTKYEAGCTAPEQKILFDFRKR